MNRAQQRRLNAMCDDLSAQIALIEPADGPSYYAHISRGGGRVMHRDDWRHAFAGVQCGSRRVPNPMEPMKLIELGASSRTLSVEDASEVMEMIAAFGAELGVAFTDPAEIAAQEAHEAQGRG